MTYNSKTNYTPGLTSQDGHSSGQDSGSLSFRSLSFRTHDEQENEQIADGANCCEINHQSNVTGKPVGLAWDPGGQRISSEEEILTVRLEPRGRKALNLFSEQRGGKSR